MYCTAASLADAGLTRELSQLATPRAYAPVADDLMDATLRGGDRSGFDPADVAIADLALATINAALRDADAVIDGYLAMRKPTPYTLPLNPVPGIVTVWARQIGRYLLSRDRVTAEATDPVVRDYRDALRFLAFTRDGQFALGAEDPLPAATPGMPEYSAPTRVFDASTLADY